MSSQHLEIFKCLPLFGNFHTSLSRPIFHFKKIVQHILPVRKEQWQGERNVFCVFEAQVKEWLQQSEMWINETSGETDGSLTIQCRSLLKPFALSKTLPSLLSSTLRPLLLSPPQDLLITWSSACSPLTALHRPAGHWLLSRDQARDRPEDVRRPERSLGWIAHACRSPRPASASAAHSTTTEPGSCPTSKIGAFPGSRSWMDVGSLIDPAPECPGGCSWGLALPPPLPHPHHPLLLTFIPIFAPPIKCPITNHTSFVSHPSSHKYRLLHPTHIALAISDNAWAFNSFSNQVLSSEGLSPDQANSAPFLCHLSSNFPP